MKSKTTKRHLRRDASGASDPAPLAAAAVSETAGGSERALVQRVQGAAKTKSAFQSALNRLAKAQRREAFFQELVRYTDQLVVKELLPSEEEWVQQLLAECDLLDQQYDALAASLPKSQRRHLREVLVDKLSYLMNSWGRHELRPRWEKYLTPAERADKADAERLAGELFEDVFGFKFDPAEFTGEATPEKAAELEAKYGEQFRSALGGSAAERPRNKRQQQRELERQQAQELLDRDLKRLFKELAVKLHPDLEPDPALKLEKEELMKSLTQARDQNDFTALLRLHAEHCDTGNVAEKLLFSDSTLKTLVQLLKEKAMRLEHANIEQISGHPVLRDLPFVAEVLDLDQQAVRVMVKCRQEGLRLQIQKCATNLEAIQQGGAAFRQYLKAETQRLRAEQDDDELFF